MEFNEIEAVIIQIVQEADSVVRLGFCISRAVKKK